MNEEQVKAVVLFAEEHDYGRGAVHAHKVADIATSIFDQLQGHSLIPELTIEYRRTLTAACYVHDIEASPRIQQELKAPATEPTGFDRPVNPGAATVQELLERLDSPLLPELNAEDRSLLVYGLLWSTSSGTNVLRTEPLIDRRKALLLSGILRMADALDFKLRLRVRHVQVRKSPSSLRFMVRGVGPAAEEVARCQEESRMLSAALGLRIAVQEIVEN